MFSTLLVGMLDLNSARFTYCNAGNPAPVVLNPATGAKMLETEPNIPVGVVEGYEYQEQSLTLIDDFTLFIYNDSVYETENAYNEPFGQKRMMTRLNNSAISGDTPEKVLSKMKDALENHRRKEPLKDDILMLAIKIPD